MAEEKIRRLNAMSDNLNVQFDEYGTPVSEHELSLPVQWEGRSFK